MERRSYSNILLPYNRRNESGNVKPIPVRTASVIDYLSRNSARKEENITTNKLRTLFTNSHRAVLRRDFGNDLSNGSDVKHEWILDRIGITELHAVEDRLKFNPDTSTLTRVLVGNQFPDMDVPNRRCNVLISRGNSNTFTLKNGDYFMNQNIHWDGEKKSVPVHSCH